MQVNLKLLTGFVAVAELASFRKAADRLNLSHPAISAQVRLLESQLGVRLFRRTTRQVVLTAEGEVLLGRARRAIGELEAGLEQLRQAADARQGRVAIACIPTVAGSRLPRILLAFSRQYPGVTVQVRELVNQALLASVRDGKVDFAIGVVPGRDPDLKFTPLLVDDYCALLPAGSRDGGDPQGRARRRRRAGAAARDAITLRELATMPLMTLSKDTAFRGHVDQALQAGGSPATADYEFMHAATLVAMVEAGLGAAVLPRIAVPPGTALETPRIVRPVMTRTLAIVQPRDVELPPVAARLAELCSRLMAPDAPSDP